jgi:hypothetical protein
VKNQALEVLASLDSWKKAFGEINERIKAMNPDDDFGPRLSMMPSRLEDEVVKLLDAILGDEVASYFLYEAANMKGGGRILAEGVEYPIKTIGDVKRYVDATNHLDAKEEA